MERPAAIHRLGDLARHELLVPEILFSVLRAPQTRRMTSMDNDLETLSRNELVQEVVRLRNGIRRHSDSTDHELCWHHPQLWSLLPESTDPLPKVPEWPQFLRGCIRYRQSLDDQLPAAPRTMEEYDK